MSGATTFVNDTNTQFALRRWRSILGSGLFRTIVLAATAIATADEMSLSDGWREAVIALFINGIESYVSAAVATLCILLVEPRLRFLASVVLRYSAAGIVASPAVLLFVLASQIVLRGGTLTASFVARAGVSVPITVAAIAAVAGLLGQSSRVRAQSENAAPSPTRDTSEETPSKEVPFLRRLPGKLGHDLIRVSVYDHYVEAHTRRGHELILIRFSDALAELEGYDGQQIHRSHWVARAAVRRIVRGESRSLFVELQDGTRLPVSRSHEAKVRASFREKMAEPEGFEPSVRV